jgi:hypothetical protein
MATVYGVNYTKYLTGPTEANIQKRGEVSGPLHFMRDEYECSTTAATTVIYMGHKLQAGDRIQGFMFFADDCGTSCTVDIGTSYNDDEFASAINIESAAVSGNTACLVDGADYEVGTSTGDDIITITVNTASATGTLKLIVFYSKC